MPHLHQIDDKTAEKLTDLYYNPWKLSGRRCQGMLGGVIQGHLKMSALLQRCRAPVYGKDKLCWYCDKKKRGLL